MALSNSDGEFALLTVDEVRAGARPHHEEEGVLHLAVQPHDAGQSAEDLTLTALADDGQFEERAHGAVTSPAPACASRTAFSAASWSRAARSLRMNWMAFTV